MNDTDRKNQELSANRTDHYAAVAKAFLGAAPVIGPALQELIGVVVPRQRMDRLAKFAQELEERLRKVEKTLDISDLQDDAFTDLLEDSMQQAVRSQSDDRRAYIASIVANSLSEEATQHAESKYLLRLLGELSDLEVIWLRSYATRSYTGASNPADAEFRRRHSATLTPQRIHHGSSDEERQKATLQNSYRDHLVSLGLLEQRIDTDQRGDPKFNKSTRSFVNLYQLSTLGRLLLKSAGLLEDKDE